MNRTTGETRGRFAWEQAARDCHSTPALWRAYSDRVYQGLFRAWLRPGGYERALKTDLFDELFEEGLLPELLLRSREVHGVDISTVTVENTRLRAWPVEARVEDVRALSYPDDHFDLVLSNSTLDHFQNRDELDRGLAEVVRVTRPGGTCLISLDNLSNPVIWLRQALPYGWLHRLGVLPYFVGHTLGYEEFPERLRRAGLEILEQKAVMHAPRLPAIILCRLAESLAWPGVKQRFLSLLLAFEWLGCTSIAPRTGYFTVALCRKPPATSTSSPGRDST